MHDVMSVTYIALMYVGFSIRFLAWTKLAQPKLWVSNYILTAPTMFKIVTILCFKCQHSLLHKQNWPMLFYCCANVAQVLSH